MERSAKHWIDSALGAPNVREVEFAAPVLARLDPFVTAMQGVAPDQTGLSAAGLAFDIVRPAGWDSDICWISQADRTGFAFFEEIFAATELGPAFAPHIDCVHAPRLYSGFFVTRSRCDKPAWHYDWVDGDNDGFTLIAPLSPNCEELGLVYAGFRGEQREYRYRRGKGLVFGDHFCHATAPGTSAGPTVLLSLTFGTDRMDNWARLSSTAGQQGLLHRRPDGVFMRQGQEVSLP